MEASPNGDQQAVVRSQREDKILMDLTAELRNHRLLAIVRGTDARATVATCTTLVEAGIRMLEVSLTTPDAFKVLTEVASTLGAQVLLGAGTVLAAQDVDRVRDSGADYVVTPALAPSIDRAREIGMPVLGGGLTPSEIVAVCAAGAAAVKIFPASAVSPDYIKAVLDPLPNVALVPVGGVSIDTAAAFLNAGAVAVGVGSPLCGDAAAGGSQYELAQRAERFLAELR